MNYLLKVKGVSGRKEVYRNLKRLQYRLTLNSNKGLQEAGEHLRDKAIENLVNSSQNPYLSIDGQSIADKDNWKIERQKSYHYTVDCTSDHANIVEFGGVGKVLARSKKKKGFPIGRQQGAGDNWKSSFTLQTPKSFYRGAIQSPTIKSQLNNVISYNLKRSLRGF